MAEKKEKKNTKCTQHRSDLATAIAEHADSAEINLEAFLADDSAKTPEPESSVKAAPADRFTPDSQEVAERWENEVTAAHPDAAQPTDTLVVDTRDDGIVDGRIDDEVTRRNPSPIADSGRTLPLTLLSDRVRAGLIDSKEALARAAKGNRR